MPIQLQEFVIEAGDNEQEAKCLLFAEVIARCGEGKVKAWGTSMVPTILPGDTLMVERRTISELAGGDLAVYLHSGRLFAHRVVRVLNESESVLITRGDAMECDDPPVFAGEVVGRVTSIIPDARITRRVRRGLSALRNAASTLLLLQP